MTTDRLINVLVVVMLAEMMAAIGMRVTFAELRCVGRDGGLVVRSALANYVCVPVATVGLVWLFGPHPMVAAGFLILAVCPGAPFGPPLAGFAGGNVPVAVGLMVLLAGSSALLAPVLLGLLMPAVSEGEPLEIDTIRIVGTLLMTQLLPLCVGLAVRRWRPTLADRLRKPARQVGAILALTTLGLVLATQGHLLGQVRPRGYVAMFALLVASWVAGWLLGGRATDVRRTQTLITSLRNVGVGLVIATGNFGGTPAVTAVVVYGLFEIVGSLALAAWWGRGARTTAPAPGAGEYDEPSGEPLRSGSDGTRTGRDSCTQGEAP